MNLYDAALSDFPRLFGETDDAPRILRAVESAGRGGVVYFPGGVYEIGSMLHITNLVSLELAQDAILRATADMEYVIRYDVYMNRASGASVDLEKFARERDWNLFIRGGILDGENRASCLSVNGAFHFSIRDMEFRNGLVYGYRQDDYSLSFEVVMTGCTFSRVDPGLGTAISIHSSDCHFESCNIISWDVGVSVNSPGAKYALGSNRFSGISVTNCGTGFFIRDNTNDTILRGCRAISCGTGFRIDSDTRMSECASRDCRTVISHPEGRLLVSGGDYASAKKATFYTGSAEAIFRDNRIAPPLALPDKAWKWKPIPSGNAGNLSDCVDEIYNQKHAD